MYVIFAGYHKGTKGVDAHMIRCVIQTDQRHSQDNRAKLLYIRIYIYSLLTRRLKQHRGEMDREVPACPL